LDLILKIIGGT